MKLSAMTRQTLWLVVGLMSIALVGLVSIQLYWVQTAIALKQSQFDMAVQSALHAVVTRLEAQEARQRVAQVANVDDNLSDPALGGDAHLLTTTSFDNRSAQPPPPPVPMLPPSPASCVIVANGKVVAYDTVLSAVAPAPRVYARMTPPAGQPHGSRWRELPPPPGNPPAEAFRKLTSTDMSQVVRQQQIARRLQARAQRQHQAQAEMMTELAELELQLAQKLTPEQKRQLELARQRLQGNIARIQEMQVIMLAADSLRFLGRLTPTIVEATAPTAGRSEFMVTLGEGYRMEAWPSVPGTARARYEAQKEQDEARRRQMEQSQAASQREIKRLNQKLQTLRVAIQDYIYNPPPAPQRLDSNQVRQVLAQELTSRGITAEMTCGIRAGDIHLQLASNATPVSTDGAPRLKGPSQPEQTQYAAQLFPNDLRPQPYYLTVNFPSQRSYVLKSISGILAICAIFISFIVIGFTYTVRTILHQKKLSQMKTDFINNMTHEFKTPIATISLAAEAVGEPHVQQNPEKMARFLRVIREENKRMESQVERVLHMAEIERGQLELSLSPVDAHDILRDALQKIALQVEKRGGQVNLNLTATRTLLEADALHLGNIFYNLLDNANKYSPEAPHISVATHNLGGLLRVTVADKGIGMTESQQKRIFESFYRVHTGNRHDVKGFGLGLSYVRSMVEAHGGTISVRSEPGKGSKFELCFPVRNSA